jgi:acyl-CoA synthetase (AMP-forming)/AMP-acid ligase II
LAESTLIVSGYGGDKQIRTFTADRSELEMGRVVHATDYDPANNQELVSCGPPLIKTKVAVVDPNTLTRSKPDEIGEIWVSGGNVAEGYWNRLEETKRAFKARIADTGEGPFLRTGDLGFMHKGEIYITGREKDLIIIRGRNYYPQDIEYTVQESHPVLRPGCGAAFSILVDGMEHLVMVQEIRPKEQGADTWDAIIKRIRFDVAREHGIRAYSVVLINPSSIPKTSSGKIQRAESRKLFLNGEFDPVAQWRAPMDG